jgi:hypothetical protein
MIMTARARRKGRGKPGLPEIANTRSIGFETRGRNTRGEPPGTA